MQPEYRALDLRYLDAGHSTGAALVKAGGDSWFFITVDYAFGHSVEAETTRFVKAAGGQVLGSARFPFPGTTDFSAFLLRAQAAGPRWWRWPAAARI